MRAQVLRLSACQGLVHYRSIVLGSDGMQEVMQERLDMLRSKALVDSGSPIS